MVRLPPAWTIRRRPRPLRAFSASPPASCSRQRERDAAERRAAVDPQTQARADVRAPLPGRVARRTGGRPDRLGHRAGSAPARRRGDEERVDVTVGEGLRRDRRGPAPAAARGAQRAAVELEPDRPDLARGRAERERQRRVGRDGAVGLHPQADRADARNVQAPEAEAGDDLAALGAREQAAVDDAQVVRRGGRRGGGGARRRVLRLRAAGCGLPVTTAVTGDGAFAVPPGPVAVTTTRIVDADVGGDQVVRRPGGAGDVDAVRSPSRRSAATDA